MTEMIAGAGIEYPREASYGQSEARRCFIEKLNHISPNGPVDSLRNTAFPRYSHARLAGYLVPSSWIWPPRGSTDPMPEEIRELLQALESWAISFRLTQPFIYAAVLSTFDKWHESPEAEKVLEYRLTLPMLCRAHVAEVTTVMEWLPGHDSRSEARAKYLELAARDFDRAAGRFEGTGVRFDSEDLSLFVASQVFSASAGLIGTAYQCVEDHSVIRRKLRRACRILGWQGPRFRALPGRRRAA